LSGRKLLKRPAEVCFTGAFLLLAVLFATNVYRAWTQSITVDEAFTYHQWVAKPLAWMFEYFDDNNHLLHSLLCRLSVGALGVSEFTLRIPSLLGGLLYFAGVFRLSALLFGRSGWFLLSVALNSLNPFLLDYLSAARGYGLALGLWVWAAYYLLRSGPAGAVPASIALGLSVASQLTFLFPSVALVAVFLVVRLAGSLLNKVSPDRVRSLRQSALPFCLAGLAIAALILWGPLQNARVGTHYGEPSFQRSLGFLFEASLIHSSAGPASRPAIENLFLRALNVLLWAGLLLLALQVAKVALGWLSARGCGPHEERDRHFLILAGAALLTFLLAWLEPKVFRHPYPSERMMLYLLPLLSLAGLLSLRRFWGPSPFQRAILLCGALPVGVILAEFIVHFSVTTYFGWEFDAGTKRIANRIRKQHGRSPQSQVRVGANWTLQESLNFYRAACRMDWMAPVTREGPECYFDYYVFLEENRPGLKRFGLEDLYKDGVSGAVLARPGQGILRELRALREAGFQERPPCSIDFSRLGPAVDVRDGQATAQLLRDFLGAEKPDRWHWTAEKPAVLFRVKPGRSPKFWMEFVIHDAIFLQTGPETLSVWVNGRLLGQRRYVTAGSQTYEGAVPAQWLREDGLTLVEMQFDKPYVAPADGQKLSFLFIRAGFAQ